MGQAYLRNKDASLAKNVYEAIIKQIPQDVIAHYQFGSIARQDKDHEGVMAHFEEALRYNPRFIQALSQISSIRVSRGEAGQARQRVQQQIEVTPDDSFLYNLLGGLWMEANQADKAEHAFK